MIESGVRRSCRCFLTILLMYAGVGTSPVRAADVVHFNSLGEPPSLAQIQAAEAKGEAPPESLGSPIWGHLAKPDGVGPFPAIVLLHGCSGIREAYSDWAKWLNDLGYVTLIVDSFGPHSVFSVCRGPSESVSPITQALDAHGAHAYLAGQSFIDPDRIAVIGWSHGAIATLFAVRSDGLSSQFPRVFRAAIGFYPYCLGSEVLETPTLILAGNADTWTPVSRCELMKSRDFNTDAPIDLIIYPGAYHAFDFEEVGAGFEVEGFGGKRYRLQYDKPAHQDARVRIRAFLEANLTKQ